MKIVGSAGCRLHVLLCTGLMFVCFSCVQVQAANGDTKQGRVLFEKNCVSCHGPNGNGQGEALTESLPEPRDFSRNEFKFDTDADWQRGTYSDLADVINNGAAAYGGSAIMPAWAGLSPQDVKNLVAYIQSLKQQ